MRLHYSIYREAQRQARDDEAAQWIINFWRRITFRRVEKTGAERYKETLLRVLKKGGAS